MGDYQTSPEIKELFKAWAKLQQEKYGDDWKSKLAQEMIKEAETQQFIAWFVKKMQEVKGK
jgi:hypothetical protein